MNKIGTISGKNILFLQGPMGSFFKNVDLAFRKKGAKTFKIGLNAGDWVFSNKDNYTPYKGKQNDWGKYIYAFLLKHKIDKVFLFGDCRFYQRIALQVANELKIQVYVFEEGYIRPDFITMERHGVNSFSHTPREAEFYQKLNINTLVEKRVFDAQSKYYRKGWSATTYTVIKDLFWFLYPHYKHHTHHNFITEAFYGTRNAFRKYKYKLREKPLLKKISKQYKNNYYFVPLQTYNDFQIKEHSPFSSIEDFIKEVMKSFMKFAELGTLLVIKHHPMDRGKKNYTKYINELSAELGIKNRVIIIHDVHLPSCLKNAIGTVTINSTAGLSSLYHNTPTIVLGNAIYDIEGLTCKDMTLDDFWENYKVPDEELYKKFRQYLINTTQLNGSFYGIIPYELQWIERRRGG